MSKTPNKANTRKRHLAHTCRTGMARKRINWLSKWSHVAALGLYMTRVLVESLDLEAYVSFVTQLIITHHENSIYAWSHLLQFKSERRLYLKAEMLRYYVNPKSISKPNIRACLYSLYLKVSTLFSYVFFLYHETIKYRLKF